MFEMVNSNEKGQRIICKFMVCIHTYVQGQYSTEIMGPKSKYLQIRAPPKKSKVYRLNLTDNSESMELESIRKVSQHSGTARKNLKRNVDQMSPAISIRHRKKNKKAENLNTSLIDEPCTTTIDQKKSITEPYLKPPNLTRREIPDKTEVLGPGVTGQSSRENPKPHIDDRNESKQNSSSNGSTINQLPDNHELEVTIPNTTDTLTIITADEMISNVCMIEPTIANPTAVLSFVGSNCHPLESGHYNVIEDGTTTILAELAKLQKSIEKIIDMKQECLQNHKKNQEFSEEVIRELQSIKNQNSAYESREKWLLDNGINLPMKSMEEFTAYNVLIKQSSECRKILETSVHFAVNGKKSLTKNIAAVLRKYFTGELASQFTVIKSVKGKVVLATTSFYEHMLRYFLDKSAAGILPLGLTEFDFNKALGEVMCNAKDWNKSKLMKRIEYESTAALLN